MFFSVLVAILLQASMPGSYKDRSCISGRTMMYCELWGGVRMSNHCDVTFTEWDLPLPLILSTIAFNECTGWLSFNWCISLISMGDLIGYLIDVTTFVKQHIHYNQILLCNWWQHFRNGLNTCNLMHKKNISMFIISILINIMLYIHWVKLMLILMGTNDAPLISIYFDWIWFHVKMCVISNGSWNNKEREKWQTCHF